METAAPNRARNRAPSLRLLAVGSSILSMILTMAALEVFVRNYYFAEVDSTLLREQLAGSSVRALVEPSDDPLLFFELKPNLRVWQRAWVITGADRYRIAMRPTRPPAPARYRIAVIGDSTSFGWGVNYDDSYPERYRRRIEELTGQPVELRNYSVPAYNAAQELRIFQTRVKSFRPDVLLLHHDHNDAEPTARMMGASYMPPEYGDNVLHSALWKWTARRLRQIRSEAEDDDANQKLGGYYVSGPFYSAHLDARQELAAEANAANIRVVAILFNAFVQRDDGYRQAPVYQALHRDLAAALRPMGYHVLDLYPAYQSLLRERDWNDLSSLWLSPTDGHPNAEGHHFIAETLVDYTLQNAALASAFGLERPAAPARDQASTP